MDNLISIELSFDEWNKVLNGIYNALIFSKGDEIKEYKDIQESIYNQMKLGIHEIIKKESH